MIFLGHILSADEISVNPDRVDRVKDWTVPQNAKDCNYSWEWHLTITSLFLTLPMWPRVFHHLNSQVKRKG